MSWSKPSYINANAPWSNANIDTLLDALDNAFGDMNGVNFKATTTISMETDLVGGLQLWGFPNLLGHSGAGTIDATAHDFGKSGNSSAENTTALQAAVDALPDTGGTVIIPPGEYTLNAPIYVRGTGGSQANVAIQGAGKATMLTVDTASAAHGLFRLGGSGSVLSGHSLMDLYIDMDSKAGRGIVVDETSNAIIQNVFIENGNASYDMVFIDKNDTNNILIDECTFANCAGDCIQLYTENATDRPWFVTVSNCLFDSNSKNGVSVKDGDGLRVVQNHFRNHGASTGYAGVYVEPHTIATVAANPVVISGNIFEGGSGAGVIVANYREDDATIRGILVQDNIFSDLYTVAVYQIRDNGTSDDVCRIAGSVISSNVIVNNGTSNGFGILFQGHPGASTLGDSGRLCVIVGNAVGRNSHSGIAIYSPDNTHGTGGDRTRANTVVGNVSSDDRGDNATQDDGVRFDTYSSNTTWIQDHIAVANVVHGNTTEFTDEGTNTSYGHNPGY